MATFTPPVQNLVPTVAADADPLANRLRSHYGPNPRGVNVFLYADGTVTQITPSRTSNEPGVVEPVAPEFTYYGGHSYPNLTAFEVTSLTAAGYTLT